MPQDLAAQTIFDLTPPTDEQFAELVADLNDEEKHVLLEHGTEAPFCGVFLNEKRPGVFTCRLCGLPLFHGGTKFESGTGWPSFTQPFAEGHLRTIRDTSYGMVRTEIVCARCGSHMGAPSGQAWAGCARGRRVGRLSPIGADEKGRPVAEPPPSSRECFKTSAKPI